MFPTVRPIQGRVVDESGWPVVGAVVLQYGKSGNNSVIRNAAQPPYSIINRARTDIRGKFKFQFDSLDHKFRTYFHVAHPSFQKKRIRSPLDLFSDIVLEKGETIRGRILTESGKPIEGVDIKLDYWLSEESIGFAKDQTQTGADGEFSLDNAVVDGFCSIWVTVPGKLKRNVYWFDSKQNEGNTDGYKNLTVVFGDEFEFRLPPKRSVKIQAISAETGEPVEIKKASLGSNSQANSTYFSTYHSEVAIKGNIVSYDYLTDGTNRFWIYPKPESNYLNCFVDVILAKDEKAPDVVEIKLATGVKVTGRVVDKITQQPIKDAAIKYEPSNQGTLQRAGVYWPKFKRTDEKGIFNFLVPPTPAKFQVVGDCENYKTLPIDYLNRNSYSVVYSVDGSHERVKPGFDVPECLVQTIDPQPNQAIDLKPFELESSVIVSGIVTDEGGKPLSDVLILARRNRFTRGRRIVCGKTDKNGRFEIPNLLTNSLGIPPRSAPRSGDSSNKNAFQPDSANIFFCHQEFALNADIVVSEDQKTEELTVVLKPSFAAWGRVVDSITKEPVPEVKISLNSYTSGLQIGAVTSRSDGTFLLEHLSRKPANASFVNAEYRSGQLSVNVKDEAKLVIELDDFALKKKFAFGKPAELESLIDFDKKEAIQAIQSHMQTELDKLPPAEKNGSWSSSDPDVLFKTNLAKGLTDEVEHLLAQNSDLDYQTQVAHSILLKLSDPRGGYMIPYSPITIKLKTILEVNVDREGVFEFLKNGQFSWHSSVRNYSILKNSKKPEIRKWALSTALNDIQGQLGDNMKVNSSSSNEKLFQTTMDQAVEIWRIGLSEFPNEVDQFGRTFQEVVHANMKNILKDSSGTEHDEVRVKSIQQAIDEMTIGEAGEVPK